MSVGARHNMLVMNTKCGWTTRPALPAQVPRSLIPAPSVKYVWKFNSQRAISCGRDGAALEPVFGVGTAVWKLLNKSLVCLTNSWQLPLPRTCPATTIDVHSPGFRKPFSGSVWLPCSPSAAGCGPEMRRGEGVNLASDVARAVAWRRRLNQSRLARLSLM